MTNPLPGAAADASVQLAELIVEDSDDDHDDDPAHKSKTKSTSTFQTVKSRIRRHLSQDSLSRQSESEEQIARRAEVKRLLRKRIQEELRSEADVPPSTPPRLVSGQGKLGVNGPRDTIEFAVDEVKRDKELARFKAYHLAQSKEHQCRLSNPFFSNDKENRGLEGRAASLPDWVDAESNPSQSDSHHGLRERSSVPGIPKSPTILPVRGLSFNDAPSLISWRLSLSADKPDGTLTSHNNSSVTRRVANSLASCSMPDVKKSEPPNRQRSISSPLVTHNYDNANILHSRQASLNSTMRDRIPASETLVRDESPVGLWLRTQSMQFRPSTTSQSPSEHGSEDYHSLHVTHHQTEAQDAFTATPTGTIRAYRQRCTERASAYLLPGPAHRINVVQAAMPPEAHTGLSSIQLSTTGPTTDSPTRTSHVKPLPNPPRKGLGGLRLPSLKWSQSSGKGHKSLKVNLPASSQPGSSSQSLPLSNARRTTTEAGSDTSSFVRREAELQAVEERFRDSHLRMEPLVPIESKFIEIFDHDGDPNADNRSSFFCRLHLNAQKRDKPVALENLDGNGTDHITLVQEPLQRTGPRPHGTSSLETPDHGHLQVPVVDRGTNRRNLGGTSLRTSRKSGESGRPRGFSCSKQGDETAQMWKRALRTESKSKSPRGSTSSDVILSPSHLGVVCDLKGVPTAPQPSGNESLNLSTPGIHSPTGERRPSRDNDAKLRENLIRSSKFLQSWAHQLESQESEARERTRSNGPASSPFVQATKMPLASWSRFPSYNHEQRNAAAGQADNIKSKDFAVKEISGAGEPNWTTDKPHDEFTLPKVVGRSFSDKFASTFKSRWSKLIPGRSGIPFRDGSMQGGRRSSIQTGGDLEYPELELLPSAGRYRELRALEREIDEMKGVKTKKRSSSDAFPTQPDRPRLTDKMAGAWQQPGAGSDAELSKTSDTTSFVEENASMMRMRSPDTPATQIQYPNVAHTKDVSGGSTVERYATPFSHFTPSEHELSRVATPDFETGFRLPPTTNSPISVKSVSSVVRRESSSSEKCLASPIGQQKTWHRQGEPNRRSAPMPVALKLM